MIYVMRCAQGALLGLTWGSGSGGGNSVGKKQGDGGSAGSSGKSLSSAHGWSRVSLMARRFLLTCTHHLLANARDPLLLAFLLRALAPHISLLLDFPVLTHKLLKTLTAHWATPLATPMAYAWWPFYVFGKWLQPSPTPPLTPC